METTYEIAVWGTGCFTLLLFITTIAILLEWDIQDDPYFTFTDVVILNRLLEDWQTWMLCSIFFFNAFLSVFNGVLIRPIFTAMIYDVGGDQMTRVFNKKERPWSMYIILILYDVWSNLRMFLNVLGIVSNFSFLLASVAGSMFAAIITTIAYMRNESWIQNVKRNGRNPSWRLLKFIDKDERVIKPMLTPSADI
tara:strand:+ start:12952 stop:13536 length:585 start_codon:yes stop_codon:yes gene_type:complete